MENILVEQRGRVVMIRLNRPDKLNALSAALFTELNAALDAAEADDGVGAIVVTGSGRAFAAGADLAELAAVADFADAASQDVITGLWERIPSCRKPVIAAVNGFALGGGCELALMCDFILAGASAKFSQPEIRLGTIPGAGGTQRLTRVVGKSKAMEMTLTGRMIDAEEAERAGLAARVIPDDKLEEEAWETATTIAAYSLPAVRLAKEAVNAALEMPLGVGVRHERRLFHATFSLADRKEGMTAFLEKRPAEFKHK